MPFAVGVVVEDLRLKIMKTWPDPFGLLHLTPSVCHKIFKARFATDPKISTQLGRRKSSTVDKGNKAFFVGHYINFIPWHKSHFNVTDVLVLSVTYVFVSYHWRVIR